MQTNRIYNLIQISTFEIQKYYISKTLKSSSAHLARKTSLAHLAEIFIICTPGRKTIISIHSWHQHTWLDKLNPSTLFVQKNTVNLYQNNLYCFYHKNKTSTMETNKTLYLTFFFKKNKSLY